MRKDCPSSGYTLIEIMVAISISLIITWVGLAYYSAFNRRQKVEQTAQTVVADMNLAKNLALSQQKPATSCDTLKAYIFDPDLSNPPSYSIYAECINSGNPLPAYSVPVKEVTLEDITLSGLTRVRFEVLTQYVKTDGGNSLTVGKDGTTYSRQITIGEGGGDIKIE